ncbi:MAG: FAD-dependent oxidoreductase, partial [Verrucomicrobiota bacterium]
MRQFLFAAVALSGLSLGSAADILIEAESFEDRGGWKLDTQFIEIMGSPYLLAHGLGNPVEDASTTIEVSEAGTYHVWVRTKNWIEKFDEHANTDTAPGTFKLAVGGTELEPTFGISGKDWAWHEGGTIDLTEGQTSLALRDLTGFGGRCDAILLTTRADYTPDNSSEILPAWRRTLMGLSEEPIDEGSFDVVFVGGGYGGMCGAISAARMGLKVALIQNRPVLGGNGSSEIRVWAKGNTPPGLYPIGDIVREVEDHAKASPGTAEEFGDEKKHRIVSAEANISLFLNHH